MPYISISLVIFLLALHSLPNSFDLLSFNRTLVNQGEWWRFLTANFVHGSWEHVVRDCAAFIGLGPLIEQRLGKIYWLYLVGSSVCITLGYFLFVPGIEIYFGISGVVSGLFGILLILELPKRWKQKAWFLFTLLLVLLIAFTAKLAFETFADSSLFYRRELGAAPLAHFLGLISGIVCGALVSFRYNVTSKVSRINFFFCGFGFLAWLSAVLWWPSS